ncbi:ABC transporter substrate-binding protein [Hahella sp. KA22]|uniref:substrate-binding periplasmic protein n=1 Tax=Hahella sp. KA22 TaxID=1628392 RepID=UPI001F4E489A|nr:transporter substrate-binding domain-containing protein [Hahella sp. KA22]
MLKDGLIRCVIVVFLLCRAVDAAAQEEITVAIGEWAPFMSESYPDYGVVPHIISEIYQKAGVKVVYGFFPWKRSYTLVQRGEWHASAIWGKTLERETDCYFSDAVYTGEIVLFYRKNNPVVWTGLKEDIQGLTIGLPLGSAKAKPLEEAEKEGMVSYDVGVDHILVFRKLLAGRFDALDENKAVGLFNLQSQFTAQEREKIGHTDPVESWPYHMIFSRKSNASSRFMEIFNAGLSELKQSGRLDEIWEAFYRGEFTAP